MPAVPIFGSPVALLNYAALVETDTAGRSVRTTGTPSTRAGWLFLLRNAKCAPGRMRANSTMWPNWAADAEFRGTRDQTAGERGGAPTPVQVLPAEEFKPALERAMNLVAASSR